MAIMTTNWENSNLFCLIDSVQYMNDQIQSNVPFSMKNCIGRNIAHAIELDAFDITSLCYLFYLFSWYTFFYFSTCMHRLTYESEMTQRVQFCYGLSVVVIPHLVCKLRLVRNRIIHLSSRTMAWRSVGRDNADLVNQLEGCFIVFYLILPSFVSRREAKWSDFHQYPNET